MKHLKRTQKYIKALKILSNFPHNSQKELYDELKRLGCCWNVRAKKWEGKNRLLLKSSILHCFQFIFRKTGMKQQ